MLKVIIAGSREFRDYEQLAERCDHYLSREVGNRPIQIVSGTARGADRLGERYARERGFKLAQFPAQWDKFPADLLAFVETSRWLSTLMR